MAETHRRRVQLLLDGRRDPGKPALSGEVRVEDDDTVSFVGWLELLRLLEDAVRDHDDTGPTPESAQ